MTSEGPFKAKLFYENIFGTISVLEMFSSEDVAISRGSNK